MQCSHRQSTRDHLFFVCKDIEGILDYLVGVIDKSAQRNTTRVNEILECEVRSCHTGELVLKTSSTERIIELTRSDWRNVFGQNRLGVVALYLPRDGKIYLHKDEWCLCNILHEILHSRSVFSKKNGPHINLKFVYEGITELLTGWILRSHFKECFESWSKTTTCFLKLYERWVKIWNYFSSKVGIEKIADIYFDTHHKEPLKNILQLAIKKGYNMKNVFTPYNPNINLESRFTNELSNAFGTDFDEYLASDLTFLNPGYV